MRIKNQIYLKNIKKIKFSFLKNIFFLTSLIYFCIYFLDNFGQISFNIDFQRNGDLLIRFHTVRGPLTGWRASDSTIIQMGTDVVLVEVDDETWRILKDNKVPWPYPRGDIWSKAVDNLSKAGASVIAFDIQFDSPDARSEYLRSVSGNLPPEFNQYLPGHGDILFAESIKNAIEGFQ